MAWCLSSENRRNNVYLDKLQNDKRHKVNQPTPTPSKIDEHLAQLLVGINTALATSSGTLPMTRARPS